MTDEIKIWAIDKSSGENKVTEVDTTNRAETERLLEDVLVEKPEMLMPGLTLVGRQTPIAGGFLDLLGVDQNGQLIVFELKRGNLTREAVTQVIDYASDLDSMNDSALAEHIAERSGHDGIEKIDNFEKWYSQYSNDEEVAFLRPVQMALVGLGVEDSASRMVNFLAKQGVQITLLTFYGYSYEGKTFLAKQVQVEPVPIEPSRLSLTRKERRETREKAAIERAESLGVNSLLEKVVEGFTQIGPHRRSPLTDGYTLYRAQIKLADDSRFNGLYSIRFTEDKRIRVTFSPMAVQLCEEQFKATKMEFICEPPPNFPPTVRISDQWYCLFNENEWQAHRETLLGLASAVYKAWNEAVRTNG